MANDVLKSFVIALGFETKGGSEFKKSIKDYEKAVVDAEAAIEKARWDGAKTEEEIAKLTRETNLKLAREALEKAREAEKREAELAKKRKEHNDALVKGFERAAVAALAFATAVGYAFHKITGSFDNLYFQAQRAGTSVQSLKAIGYAFSQTGSSAANAQSSVDAFTTSLRNNPGLRQLVRDLGVDEKLQGVDKYMAVVEKLAKMPPEIGHQYAERLGISEENFNLFQRQGEALKRYKAEYDEMSKRFGMDNDKAAEGATAFSRALTRLQATVVLLTEKLLAALAPAIQKIIDRFQEWIDKNPGALDKILTDIANAIIAVAEGIAKFIASIAGDSGDDFLKKWDAFVLRAKTFAETVERIVFALEKVLKFMGLISSSTATNTVLGDSSRTVAALNAISGGTAAPNGAGGRNTGDATPPDDRTILQKILPKSMGGRDAPKAGDGSRSWRNNNPGNIKYGPLATRMGATGADSGGFARFPSYEAGRKAQEELLFNSDGYKDKSIKDAIARWAPASDGNDPAGYAATLARAAGVGVDTKLSDLNPEQRGQLLKAQQDKEGWIPGKAAIAPGIQKGGESASYLSGKISFDGKEYEYGSGNGRGKNSIPVGTYPITPGTIGPWGQANNALGINNNQIWDKTLGRMRDGIEFHAASNANKLSAGCIAIAREQYGAFRAHVLDFVKKNGSGYLTVRPDGSAMITATPPRSENGAKTTAIGVPKMTVEPGGAGAAKPGGNMSPGGFDMKTLAPKAPMGTISAGATANSDNRSVTQHITNKTEVHGVEKPHEHARATEAALANVHRMSLQNAQSAIA